MAIEIFAADYSELQPEIYLIPVAKIGKNFSNVQARDVLGRIHAHPTSVVPDIPRAAQTANSARFWPSRKWVAKITDYLRIPNESNIMTGASAATLGIGAPIQRRSNR